MQVIQAVFFGICVLTDLSSLLTKGNDSQEQERQLKKLISLRDWMMAVLAFPVGVVSTMLICACLYKLGEQGYLLILLGLKALPTSTQKTIRKKKNGRVYFTTLLVFTGVREHWCCWVIFIHFKKMYFTIENWSCKQFQTWIVPATSWESIWTFPALCGIIRSSESADCEELHSIMTWGDLGL